MERNVSPTRRSTNDRSCSRAVARSSKASDDRLATPCAAMSRRKRTTSSDTAGGRPTSTSTMESCSNTALADGERMNASCTALTAARTTVGDTVFAWHASSTVGSKTRDRSHDTAGTSNAATKAVSVSAGLPLDPVRGLTPACRLDCPAEEEEEEEEEEEVDDVDRSPRTTSKSLPMSASVGELLRRATPRSSGSSSASVVHMVRRRVPLTSRRADSSVSVAPRTPSSGSDTNASNMSGGSSWSRRCPSGQADTRTTDATRVSRATRGSGGMGIAHVCTSGTRSASTDGVGLCMQARMTVHAVPASVAGRSEATRLSMSDAGTPARRSRRGWAPASDARYDNMPSCTSSGARLHNRQLHSRCSTAASSRPPAARCCDSSTRRGHASFCTGAPVSSRPRAGANVPAASARWRGSVAREARPSRTCGDDGSQDARESRADSVRWAESGRRTRRRRPHDRGAKEKERSSRSGPSRRRPSSMKSSAAVGGFASATKSGPSEACARTWRSSSVVAKAASGPTYPTADTSPPAGMETATRPSLVPPIQRVDDGERAR
mmetsp:Transcript_5108/g.16456  ORF Transcript_5108/g.16456 Transcript_5108/m.16456 type:complete len:551 (-) Transcript_5108:332-1984(-)